MNVENDTDALSKVTGMTLGEAVPDAVHEVANKYLGELREKILFGLSIYKFVSPSMLHVFMGTATPTSLWKEQVLAELIREGLVISEVVSLTSTFDRSQSYTILHLPENEWVNPVTPIDSTADETPETVDVAA